MNIRLKALALAGTILAAPIFTNAANAASIIGLVDGKTLVWVDPATKKVTGKTDIKGAASVVGIDVRPSDGMLYAVSADGGIYTVDAKTGQATMKSKLSETLKPGTISVDFNPVADRMRIISSDGTNLRVNVDDGKATVDGTLKFKDGDAQAGKTPTVVAAAYTNSSNPKPGATALYDIDSGGHLLSQAPPNDGHARHQDRWRGRVQHRGAGRGQCGLAGHRRHALFGRSENRQGDERRQAAGRDRHAHRYRLDRLSDLVLVVARDPGGNATHFS
jgi:hypothetical protein